MFFWGRRLCRLHFEPASLDNLFVHSTCWPRLRSAQSHCTQHLAQKEIGTVSLYTGLGPNWNRHSLTVHRSWPKRRSAQSHSNITCPAPKEQVSIQHWANIALTQHLNLNIPPPPSLHTRQATVVRNMGLTPHDSCNHKYTNEHDESVVFRLQVLITSKKEDSMDGHFQVPGSRDATLPGSGRTKRFHHLHVYPRHSVTKPTTATWCHWSLSLSVCIAYLYVD